MEKATFYTVKNKLFKTFYLSINSFLTSQPPLRSQQRTERNTEKWHLVQANGTEEERGIIFHGGRLVSVGGGDGGKCEQEQLNIISECCAV